MVCLETVYGFFTCFHCQTSEFESRNDDACLT